MATIRIDSLALDVFDLSSNLNKIAVNANFTGKVGISDMAISKAKSVLSGALASVAAMGIVATPSLAQQHQDAAITPVSASQTSARSGGLVDDADLAAIRYSKTNPGIAVAVFLGTHPQTPTQDRIKEVLDGDFAAAKLKDPVTYFFEQNDVEGSGAAFFFDGNARGPYTLAESRKEVGQLAEIYNFRKERGLLASLDYNQ